MYGMFVYVCIYIYTYMYVFFKCIYIYTCLYIYILDIYLFIFISICIFSFFFWRPGLILLVVDAHHLPIFSHTIDFYRVSCFWDKISTDQIRIGTVFRHCGIARHLITDWFVSDDPEGLAMAVGFTSFAADACSKSPSQWGEFYCGHQCMWESWVTGTSTYVVFWCISYRCMSNGKWIEERGRYRGAYDMA